VVKPTGFRAILAERGMEGALLFLAEVLEALAKRRDRRPATAVPPATPLETEDEEHNG